MNLNEYQQLALRTASPASTQNSESAITTAALGLTGEAGEFAEKIKKWLFHGHDLDRDALIKEVGDVMWYCSMAAHGLDTTLDEICIRNISKLRDRYPEKFDTARSLMGIHRD